MLATIAQFQFYVKSRKKFNQDDILLHSCILDCTLKCTSTYSREAQLL